MEKQRIYCCIDLKSFFASVECVERGLDPFKTNLVVADPARQSGTVCLAITPAMKSLGVKNRCRVFEIPSGISYIMAKPRMKKYMDKSIEIYSIYLKYISPDDIWVYSIDECFIDFTDYLKLYNMEAKEFANLLRREVFKKTGICATVGIGTNLFLAKVALDITAKHAEDFMGYLDEESFKKEIWHHRPITDVWNIGKGIAQRLERRGIHDLYGVAHYSEDLLYKEFGINAELLIDHANGIEPCTISDIQKYKTKTMSISNGQVLFSNYNYLEARTVLKEMVENLALELVEKDLVAGGLFLSIGYSDRTFAGGSEKFKTHTSSESSIIKAFLDYYDKTIDRSLYIKRINVGLTNLLKEDYTILDLFSDPVKKCKEKDLLKTVIGIKRKYGKNALLKGLSFEDGATARERNKMIGGHNSGEKG
ncbi:MAG: DNA repair protein [Clostridia bacterium]|nr:DNA repair protein [Clostridia bacterium]